MTFIGGDGASPLLVARRWLGLSWRARTLLPVFPLNRGPWGANTKTRSLGASSILVRGLLPLALSPFVAAGPKRDSRRKVRR